jgi:DNA-binding response OmpR family regulator
MHVLVIDDDSRLRQVLARLLRVSGFDIVDEAADGQSAIEMMEHIHPDLIITDCQMPRLDGIGFVRKLRAQADRTPVIMLSGLGDPHLVVIAAKAGVDNFLPKPISGEMLLDKIHQTLHHLPST